MRELAFGLLTAVFLLTGCAAPAISDKYGELTGTTLMQRCAARVAALEVLKAQPEYATSEPMQLAARLDQLWITGVCPPPFGAAPVVTPIPPVAGQGA